MRTLSPAVSIVLFISCAHPAKDNNLTVFSDLDKKLQVVSGILKSQSDNEYAYLNEKLYSYDTRREAEIWLPRATRIRKLTQNIYQYIEYLKNGLKAKASITIQDGKESFAEDNKKLAGDFFNSGGKGGPFSQLLGDYIDSLTAIDPKIDVKIYEDSLLYRLSVGIYDSKKQVIEKTFLNNTSVAASLAVLSQLQSDSRIMENRLLAFCLEQCRVFTGDWTAFSAIVAQNSSTFRNGEKLEITAGVGSFTRQADAEIEINGKKIGISGENAATYKIKTPLAFGKYSVPVRISYFDQEGKKQTIEKSVYYTVIE